MQEACKRGAASAVSCRKKYAYSRGSTFPVALAPQRLSSQTPMCPHITLKICFC